MPTVAITFDRSFAALDTLINLKPEDMRELGLLARERILRRTLSGVDVQGQQFQPYSEGYAAQKRAALGTDTVNLQVSGGMLNDMQVTAAEADGATGSVVLGWSK